jgi:hypothetical protein
MHKRVWAPLGILLLCAACQKFAEGRQIFHDLLVLRDQVGKEFHEKVVDVNLSGDKRIVVKFSNSPLQGAPREAKQKRADMVAAFVMSHYEHPVSSVSTQFAVSGGPVSASETFEGHPQP